MLFNPNLYFPYLYDPVIGAMPREYFNKPPTLYSIMQAMVNYENPNQVKIKDLAGQARIKIFDFDYPLTNKITKEYFEKLILNNFIERRINFETVTMFKIKLQVKLNEIMPRYNMLLDAMDDWSLFSDGGSTQRTYTDNRNVRNETTTSDSSTTESITAMTDDRRFSNIPENQISQVQNGEYLSTYGYDQTHNNNNASASGTSMVSQKHLT